MSSVFLLRGADPAIARVQNDNAIEATFRKEGVKNWLRSCGPTAAVMLVEAVGGNVGCLTPGGWQPQPEDVLFLYFNDPANAARIEEQRKEIDADSWFGNEIPQFYPDAIRSVFGLQCQFAWGCRPTAVRNLIRENIGVMACLDKPGHYVAVIGFDDVSGNLIYHDPWPGNYWPARLQGSPAAFRSVAEAEFAANVKPFRVEIRG